MIRGFFFGSALVAACAVGAACGGGGSQGGFASPGGGTDGGGGGGGSDGPGSFTGDGGGQTFPDSGSSGSESGTTTPVAVVYAQSADTLYRLDPTSNQIAVVGPFSGGCSSVIDIAIDSNSNGYVTTSGALWKVDLASAACTHIADGSYPNSLSFVPKGTLDPNAEALVGYVGSTYIHINTTTGAVTNVGGLTGGYTSSGDIVSVINGGTFLTVKGTSCNDCLLQVDPKTGNLIQNYGSVSHADVFGLAFWAGTAYGFDNAGQMFSIGWVNGKLVTANIPVPNPPPSLSFWGAGSTTSAPPTTADGGGIPIQ